MKKREGDEARCKSTCRENRIKSPLGLAISPNGQSLEMASPRPSHTPQGTFKNLSIHFPEGTVIKLRFRSEWSNVHSEDKDEEIYRLVDIGIGLEFGGIGAEAIGPLEEEFKCVS